MVNHTATMVYSYSMMVFISDETPQDGMYNKHNTIVDIEIFYKHII